jgi:hypothetical protein
MYTIVILDTKQDKKMNSVLIKDQALGNCEVVLIFCMHAQVKICITVSDNYYL